MTAEYHEELDRLLNQVNVIGDWKTFCESREKINRSLKEHKQFSSLLDDYFVLEIEDFQIWIPKKREEELKKVLESLLKDEILNDA